MAAVPHRPPRDPAPPPRRRLPGRRHWGRRRRRLRRTAAVLTVTAALAAIAGYLAYRSARPETRRPGEELPDITRNLARNLPAGAPAPRFTDVTAAAGLGGFRTFRGPRTSQLPEDMGPGAAWGDYDNDGDDDLFLVAAGGSLELPPEERAPCELYENLGDGTFRKVEAFPELRILGMGAAWGDYDNDGWLDLAVSGYGALRLFRNQGGRLVPDGGLPELPGFWAGLAWGDYDNDGDLDLYVTGYVRYLEEDGGRRRLMSEQYGAAVPYTLNPASYEPEANLLFRNDGSGRFTEVAGELGVANPEGRSLGALWHDFDDDGWLDLYIANDISDNALYLNRGGTFEDVSLAAWVADYRGAMGLAAGDWNRDGDDDLFITHWVAQENALYDSLLRDMAAAPAGRQGTELAFSDVAAPRGLGQIALRHVGWGTEFADFDGDGWLDLVVANGSTFETDGEPKRLKPQEPLLLWNDRGTYFHDLAPLSEPLAGARVGRGLALADYDQDGDLDIAILVHGEGVQLLRNDMQTGNWLEVRLRSRPLPDGRAGGAGEGAKLVARVGEAELRRAVTGASYLSQSSRTVHFGLGEAATVDALEVRWLGGGIETHRHLAADTIWEITEGDPIPRRLGPAAPARDRERIAAFWAKQRAAMDAMKRDGDLPRATALFREALALDPSHEDARYYLAHCLALQGRIAEALAEFATLMRVNPQSHRAHQQWGILRATSASSPADLAAAREALERALGLNPEETGSLLALGEIAILQGEGALAEERLAWACRTNPRAVGGFFLRGYLAWRRGDGEAARLLLAAARDARGEEWKPEGAAAEGDVAARMHRDETPLSRFWQAWDGSLDPGRAYRPLAAYLNGGGAGG